MTRVRVFFSISLITGCAGLIGVPDLSFDENAPQGNPDGSNGGDGPITNNDGSSIDGGGVDGNVNCDLSKVQTDKDNCGRCGHDCAGGECKAGKCEAVQIGNVGGAPLNQVVEYGTSLFVSTLTTLTTEQGGIWRTAKTTGNPVPYVTGDSFRNAESMAIIGDTLYFAVDEGPADDAGNNGGFYSCDLKGPTPCVPKLIAAAENPSALTVDKGKVFYRDGTTDKGIMSFTPGGAPIIFRQNWAPYYLWIDGEAVFYLASLGISASEERGVLFDLFTDAGDATELSRYQHPNASAGSITGDPNSVYFTAFDYDKTTGGVVRRVSRPGKPQTAQCDFGTTKNKRPDGLYIDATHLYWTNRGEVTAPYANSSVARCELSGCCADPETLWTGEGEPVAITGDDKALYYVTKRSSAIWKLAKP